MKRTINEKIKKNLRTLGEILAMYFMVMLMTFMVLGGNHLADIIHGWWQTARWYLLTATIGFVAATIPLFLRIGKEFKRNERMQEAIKEKNKQIRQLQKICKNMQLELNEKKQIENELRAKENAESLQKIFGDPDLKDREEPKDRLEVADDDPKVEDDNLEEGCPTDEETPYNELDVDDVLKLFTN